MLLLGEGEVVCVMRGPNGGTNNYGDRIVRDQNVCGGEPVFKGTRVTLRTVLASLAAGHSVDEIVAEFPSLAADDVKAAIVFAAASAEEDMPLPATPPIR